MAESSLAPTRKVVAVGVSGAVTTIIISICNRNGLALTADEAAAITALVTFALGYLIPNQPSG
jgi:hypothetical protein